ncbi:NADH dehydrogenase [ubiquinone] iron-sulfur protein 3, mitochondrial-like [Helicoverpa zea]|uniref:NADH dehydrogenase [ubiquinone] iron-sulfur protein 3, mitochondrial-like n=1 Tax=Helicoverpa zea TaxID=7113 RepID=UPI001F59B451|nr:NADH dehydrogenase [ubiquinone] iron-sulfur protein 3, mitochondrial-like [Helicoverpa zea]
MNCLLSKLVKRTLVTSLPRKFLIGIPAAEKDMQVNNPLLIEPLEYESHTLRRHDNAKRQRLYEYGIYVAACLPKWVQKVQLQQTDELEVLIAPEGLFQVLSFMRLHQNACFAQCSSATAIDVPSRPFRFEVEYDLLSFRFGERIRVKTYTDELTPLRSGSGVWKSCQWYEREIYDMFGVIFSHHPDLRRILTDYGFAGHPLRKDFPLIGYIEVRYDDELKKIVYEPMEYPQEARSYELQTPWHYLNKFHPGYDEPKPPPKPPAPAAGSC